VTVHEYIILSHKTLNKVISRLTRLSAEYLDKKVSLFLRG